MRRERERGRASRGSWVSLNMVLLNVVSVFMFCAFEFKRLGVD